MNMKKVLFYYNNGEYYIELNILTDELMAVNDKGQLVCRLFHKGKNIIGVDWYNKIDYFILRGNKYLHIGTDKEFDKEQTILISIVDGLGNQMTQYAFALFLKKQGKNTKIDPRWFRQSNSYRKELLSKFNLLPELGFCSKHESSVFPVAKQEDNKNLCYGYDWSKVKEDINLFGYWQDYQYINGNEEDLKKAFYLNNQELDESNKFLLDEIKSKNSVMIHIRRGDYFKYPERYNVLDKDYYEKAIEIIKSKVENPYFYCFGEDVSWIKENISLSDNEYKIVDINLGDEERCIFDLELMKNCKHQIIANSTFSWWSAILNNNENKIIITPDDWGNSFTETINNEEWIKI